MLFKWFFPGLIDDSLPAEIRSEPQLSVKYYNRANELYTFHKRNVQKKLFFGAFKKRLSGF